jgi:small subunit ribosomal protein S18
MANENNERSIRREEKPYQKRRKKVCSFCLEKNLKIDLKDSIKLRRFISERTKILPRRTTGTCAGHQRVIANLIKRARFLALLPYVAE